MDVSFKCGVTQVCETEEYKITNTSKIMKLIFTETCQNRLISHQD